jgi:hypothetical protein
MGPLNGDDLGALAMLVVAMQQHQAERQAGQTYARGFRERRTRYESGADRPLKRVSSLSWRSVWISGRGVR